ncbi:hypothetical protein [Peribacillus simplex]|nr:hypothetical protein [Peribacillus simplex]MEC1400244.1 hypothetical protein [Peribacillus simplex]MED3912356.1 hypothetical protein [Peribacillus simplex]
MGKKKRTFDIEFKKKAVDLYPWGGMSFFIISFSASTRFIFVSVF